jgi:hypothetical protein
LDELIRRIQNWFLNDLNGDSSIIDTMSEADLDRCLADSGIDASALVLSECPLKSVLEHLMQRSSDGSRGCDGGHARPHPRPPELT